MSFRCPRSHLECQKSFLGGGGGGGWYIPIIESALGPDPESRERE